MSKILAIIISIIIGILSFLGLTNMSSCVAEKFPDYEEYLVTDNSEDIYSEDVYSEDIYSEDDIFNSDILEDADPEPAEIIDDDIIYADDILDDFLEYVYFGSLMMELPYSFELKYDYSSDSELYVYGQDLETGVQFEIYEYHDPENSAIDILEMYQDILGEEIQDINGVPVIIIYDEDTDTDVCLCADMIADSLMLIGFDRLYGENVGADFFATISAQ